MEIYPSHDELISMMYEADVSNKGYISENDFLYIIAKQKYDYKNKLYADARDAFIALGGKSDLSGTISTKKIEETLKNNFELSDDLEVIIFYLESVEENIS